MNRYANSDDDPDRILESGVIDVPEEELVRMLVEIGILKEK